jgi:hypothetical protein
MNIRMTTAAGLMLALAGCTTIPSVPSNPVAERWVGQSAGRFFASYGPPIADRDEGGGRVYSWRGGYKTVHVPARYAASDTGKKGKPVAGARTLYLSCKADIETDSNYVIRSIHILGDMPSATGPSYCAELLAPAPAKS